MQKQQTGDTEPAVQCCLMGYPAPNNAAKVFKLLSHKKIPHHTDRGFLKPQPVLLHGLYTAHPPQVRVTKTLRVLKTIAQRTVKANVR